MNSLNELQQALARRLLRGQHPVVHDLPSFWDVVLRYDPLLHRWTVAETH